MSDTMNKKYLIIILLIPLIMSAVYGHGVDVTADTMVIADETNGQLAKDIADSNGMNISVYKFTSQADVEHILEHSVLEGSEKFPVKDPFVELVKGSLNTFLNAMTYPDKTCYPVASCNDQDFQKTG